MIFAIALTLTVLIYCAAVGWGLSKLIDKMDDRSFTEGPTMTAVVALAFLLASALPAAIVAVTT